MALADEIRSVLKDPLNLPPELLECVRQHVAQHPVDTYAQRAPVLIPTGTPGATAASRFVGATVSGAPTKGTYVVGDVATAQNGHIFVCTVAGTPGTWVDVVGAVGTNVLDYVEHDLTGSGGILTVSGHGADDITAPVFIQGAAITLDGSTQVCIEAFIAASEPDIGASIGMDLWDGSTFICTLSDSSTPKGSGVGGKDATTMYARRFLTPSAGSHTYAIRLWAVNDVGTSSGAVSSGTNTNPSPDPNKWAVAYYRVTRGDGAGPPGATGPTGAAGSPGGATGATGPGGATGPAGGGTKVYLSKPAGSITRAATTVGAFSTAWQITGVVVAAGQNVRLRMSAAASDGGTGHDRNFTLKRGATTIAAATFNSSVFINTLEWVDENPGAGTYTYEVQGAEFVSGTLTVFQSVPSTDVAGGSSIFTAEVYTP